MAIWEPVFAKPRRLVDTTEAPWDTCVLTPELSTFCLAIYAAYEALDIVVDPKSLTELATCPRAPNIWKGS